MELDYAPSKLIQDKYSKLILKSTITPKHAAEISKETHIPLGTVYRRLKILKNSGLLKIAGYIENGVRVKTYHNKPQKYHVLNPRIALLLEIIKQNPGICFSGIHKLSKIPHGTLTNSLFNLEKDSKITVTRSSRRTHYFLMYVPSEEHPTLINLRKETAKRIILYLMNNERGTFSEIKTIINKSAPTVSYTLTNLIENNIIHRVQGLQPYFELQDTKIIQSAMNRIEPNTVDKMKDRFADTFSYF